MTVTTAAIRRDFSLHARPLGCTKQLAKIARTVGYLQPPHDWRCTAPLAAAAGTGARMCERVPSQVCVFHSYQDCSECSGQLRQQTWARTPIVAKRDALKAA